MPLNKAKGNNYNWITHSHNHLAGKCPHACTYCSVQDMANHYPALKAKYSGSPRLIEKEFSVNYGSGKTIFMENCNDLFADDVPQEFIHKVLRHCKEYEENSYVFQTKNPGRMFYVGKLRWPVNNIVGVTIESNRDYPEISLAPPPIKRARSMQLIRGRKFLTIEPLLDFDVDILASWIVVINPEFVNIGADSKKHHLPEPSAEKVNDLIRLITEAGMEVREKANLERLK